MPAFFLLSGFFGALLWQRRGARAMLKNRIERIVLPFAVFVVLLYPLRSASALARGWWRTQRSRSKVR
jgi:fucose 4-O-acetylase-like acetyltransferase